MTKKIRKLYDAIGSKYVFVFIVFFLIIESLYIALTAKYPQAFDEGVHFGLIKVYSHYLTPFFSSQPAHANSYGAVQVNPSFLFEYLMSFIYRLIELIWKTSLSQIIVLRIIDVFLLSSSLIYFRRIIKKVGLSDPVNHIILLIFIFIPIVPLLAATINYDNLMIPLVAINVYQGLNVLESLRAKKIKIMPILYFITIGTIAALVKYAFLPIFAAMILFLLIYLIKQYKADFNKLFHQLKNSWLASQLFKRILISLALIVLVGTFIQRDVFNLIDYGSIQPNCSKVISLKDCLNYSTWAYNYNDHLNLLAHKTKVGNPLAYPFEWLYWMWYRLFFAVAGPKTNFENYPPLPLPSLAGLVILIVGILTTIYYFKRIFKANLLLQFIGFLSLIYIIALFIQGLVTYYYTAVPENMNGRYLLPVIIFIGVIFARGISNLVRHNNLVKVLLALIIIFFFIDGGGVFTYIIRAQPSWDIDRPAVKQLDKSLKKITKKVITKNSKDYKSKIWFFNSK